MGSYQCLGQAAISGVEPAFAPVPEEVGLSWGLSAHWPANATPVCSLGSELCHTRRYAECGQVLPKLKDCQNSSKGKASNSRGRAGVGRSLRQCYPECLVELKLCGNAVAKTMGSFSGRRTNGVIFWMQKLRLLEVSGSRCCS